MAADAPEFTHHAPGDWINSAPLSLQSLRGDVVLIEFWTFDCYNCRNTLPWLKAVDVMHLHSPTSAILSAVIFNALIIPLLIPVALKGVRYRALGADALLRRNLLVWGLGGIIAPFIGIKAIDLAMTTLHLVA